MSLWGLVLSNLRFSRRQHLGTGAGVALCSMILVGALTIGDSARNALDRQTAERIGAVRQAFYSEDGFFRADLSSRLLARLSGKARQRVASALMVRGTLSSPDSKVRAEGVQVLGVDDAFFEFAPGRENHPRIKGNGFWLSPELFREMGASPGERLVLRVEEASVFSREAPMSGEAHDRFASWNLPLAGRVESDSLGSFSLSGDMEPVRTVFISVERLQEAMFKEFHEEANSSNYANLLLCSTDLEGEQLEKSLDEAWSLDDAGIQIRRLPKLDAWSVRYRKVFLPDSLEESVRTIAPEAEGELTYLVNAMRGRESALVPYSMIAGVEPGQCGVLPEDWEPGRVALNQWAADDLNLSVGDPVTLEYFVAAEKGELVERSKAFVLGRILPMPDKLAPGEESDWTPNFPGLREARTCGDWNTGFPLIYKVRPKDEDYWKEYRSEPKAYVALSDAREMWGNRWGNLTGLRITNPEDAEKVEAGLRNILSPKWSGVRRFDAMEKLSAEGPIDFGQLFAAFGFFVILAGVSLSAMLFLFSVEGRSSQTGLLLALGFSWAKVRQVLFMEAAVVCLAGSIMGVGWAWFFAKSVLWLLAGAWSGAVADLGVNYAPNTESILWGAGLAWVLGTGALAWAVSTSRAPAISRLLAGLPGSEALSTASSEGGGIVAACEKLLWIGVVVTLALAIFFSWSPAPAFFGVGALILAAGLMRFPRRKKSKNPLSATNQRGLSEKLDPRQGRTTVVVGTLSVALFLVIGAGAFRKELPVDAANRACGTGGYEYLLRTTLPIYEDVSAAKGRLALGLDERKLKGIDLIGLRISAGDDASCLNLHPSLRPPLYGVPIDQVSGRFSFVSGSWEELRQKRGEALPAVVDQNTLLWSLGKKLGDRISFEDEMGSPFEVEIAAVVKDSILQGGLYLSERHWIEKYPGRGGYERFWLDAPSDRLDPALSMLGERLSNYGLQAQSTLDRLARLFRVEGAYLSVFQALGAWGVLLGTIGLVVVVVRNLWEARRQHAILEAIGFSPRQLRSLWRWANLRIVAHGALLGLLAALVSLVPSWMNLSISGSGFQWIMVGILFLASSVLSVEIAVRLAMGRSKLDELRRE